MEKLSTPTGTMEIVRKFGFSFQKKYGQNFLVDSHILERIVQASGIGPEDCVVEIGPGIGTLTQYLAAAAGKVIAVEIDAKLIPVLAETLQGYTNVTVLNQDILKTDLGEIAQRYNEGKPLKIVANLPYYITTPILMEILEGNAPAESITVMVQKEVAQRMQAKPGTKEYGALSLAVQYYAVPEIVAHAAPGCFIPRPEVASTVIRLDLSRRSDLTREEEKQLFSLIRAAFSQRRKTLANSLKNAPSLSCDREQAVSALRTLGLAENIRGEALSLEQFLMLRRELVSAFPSVFHEKGGTQCCRQA